MISNYAARPGGGRAIDVSTPALDDLGASASCGAGITKLVRQGRLGELQRDIARVAKAVDAVTGPADADRYYETAMQVTDPATREAYLGKARELRKAGRA